MNIRPNYTDESMSHLNTVQLTPGNDYDRAFLKELIELFQNGGDVTVNGEHFLYRRPSASLVQPLSAEIPR